MKMRKIMSSTDIHVAGEMYRVVTLAVNARVEASMRAYEERFLNERSYQQLMREPRGHKDMQLCVLTPPISENADAGIVVLRATGALDYSVGGYMAAATHLREHGDAAKEVNFDTVFGEVKILLEASDLVSIVVDSGAHNVIEESVDFEPSANTLTKVRAKYDEAKQRFRDWDDLMLSSNGTFLTISADGHIDRSPLTGALQSEARTVNFLGHEVEVTHVEEGMKLATAPVVIGLCRFVVDPSDPLQEGFLIQ